MAFVKLSHAPRGTSGETYINPDHIVEVVISHTGGGPVATVKYIGGAESQFTEGTVQELLDIMVTPPPSQSQVIEERAEDGLP
ncbi:MAG: hypothetical protein M3P51_01915 [Chloroflexota bacterium]|nr:hypothetical protein [Chloroflexota bacterium]